MQLSEKVAPTGRLGRNSTVLAGVIARFSKTSTKGTIKSVLDPAGVELLEECGSLGVPLTRAGVVARVVPNSGLIGGLVVLKRLSTPTEVPSKLPALISDVLVTFCSTQFQRNHMVLLNIVSAFM